MKNSNKSEINELKSLILKYDSAYYHDSNPLISDYDYDMLLEKLNKLEAEDNFVQKDLFSSITPVGSDLSNKFKKITHSQKMLSISNSYNVTDLIDFDQRVKKNLDSKQDIMYCVEHKIDGIAIAIKYKNGIIDYASTRGDGVVGDDITENAKHISNVSTKLKKEGLRYDFEVRGEIYINYKDFQDINLKRKEEGKNIFANPRNAAGGSLKLLDKDELKTRKLRAIFYSLLGDITEVSQFENLEKIKKYDLPAPIYKKRCYGIQSVIEECKFWEENKDSLGYPIDGMVIKVDDTSLYKKLGETSKSPRWVIAYKFKPDREESVLKNISFQVGRTGVVTPVAELSPVLLAGTIVKRATLHNYDDIIQKDLRIGDTVIIEKAGEIIPQVVRYVKEKRTGLQKMFQMIKFCPVCGSSLVRYEGEVAFRCISSVCPAQIEREFIHFAGKHGMNIIGLGEKLIKLLLKNNLVKDFADIYQLTKRDLISLDRMAEKSASNIIDMIEESKNRNLNYLIAGLGIRFVGKEASKILAERYLDLENIMKVDFLQLLEIEEIGEKIASSVINYFNDKKNIDLIYRLKTLGVNLHYNSFNIDKETAFFGKKIVMTGALQNYTREDAKLLIEERGGKIVSAVSSKTDFLLLGENPGSKYPKAQKLGIEILKEIDFKALL